MLKLFKTIVATLLYDNLWLYVISVCMIREPLKNNSIPSIGVSHASYTNPIVLMLGKCKWQVVVYFNQEKTVMSAEMMSVNDKLSSQLETQQQDMMLLERLQTEFDRSVL